MSGRCVSACLSAVCLSLLHAQDPLTAAINGLTDPERTVQSHTFLVQQGERAVPMLRASLRTTLAGAPGAERRSELLLLQRAAVVLSRLGAAALAAIPELLAVAEEAEAPAQGAAFVALARIAPFARDPERIVEVSDRLRRLRTRSWTILVSVACARLGVAVGELGLDACFDADGGNSRLVIAAAWTLADDPAARTPQRLAWLEDRLAGILRLDDAGESDAEAVVVAAEIARTLHLAGQDSRATAHALLGHEDADVRLQGLAILDTLSPGLPEDVRAAARALRDPAPPVAEQAAAVLMARGAAAMPAFGALCRQAAVTDRPRFAAQCRTTAIRILKSAEGSCRSDAARQMLGELGAAFLGATPGSAAAGAALVAPDRETEVLLVAALSGFDAMSAAWTAQLPQVVQRSTRRSQELGEALLRIASSCAPDGIAGAMNAIIAAAPALAEVPELEDRLVGVVRAQRSFFVGDAIEVLAAIRGGPDAEEAELARLGDGRHARLVLRAFAELARRERLAGHGARELVQSVLAAGELPREFLGRREPLRVGCSLGVEVDAALALALSAQGQAVAIGARVEALADVFGLEPEEVPAWIAVRIREGRMAATFRRLEERARAELLVAPGIAPLRE